MHKQILLQEEHKATGTKIFLKPMEDSHLKHVIKLAQDSSLIDLVGWNTFFNPDEPEKFIQAISDYTFPNCRTSQPIVFGVYLQAEGLPIGYVVLKGLNMDLLTAEIGVAIFDRKYRNKGPGKLALKRMIDYTAHELGIKTIGAAIVYSNKASINMCKNLGFVEKEIMYKSWEMPNGELADLVLMEWTSQA